MAGQAWGLQSPVQTFSETIYADATLEPEAALPVPTTHEERAIYVVSGLADIGGDKFPSGQLVVLRPHEPITVRNPGREALRIVIVGGELMDGPRYIWWNFVSSRRERIEQAKADWTRDRFGVVVPGDTEEFIPLPEEGTPVASNP